MKNNHFKNYLIIGAMLLCVSGSLIAQGPWLRQPKGGYVQLGANVIGPYGQIFAGNANFLDLNRDITDRTFNIYAEYGISKKLTLIANIPLKSLKAAETLKTDSDFSNNVLPAGNVLGIGNYGLTAKFGLIKNKLAGMIKIEAPVEIDAISGLNTGYDAISITPSLSIGGSMGWVYGYLNTGYAYRNNNYNSDLVMNGEIGFRMAKKRFFLIGVLDIRQNLTEGIVTNSALQTGLYTANQEFVSVGIKGLFKFDDHFGAVLYFFGAPSGQNVAASPSIGGSVFYEWGKK
jgi:hypothetical protein